MANPAGSSTDHPTLPEGMSMQQGEDGNVTVTLQPVRKDTYSKKYVPQVKEEKIEMEQIQYIERIEEVPKPYTVKKTVPVPRLELTERIVEIPKYVHQEKVVEVPQVQVIDKVSEVIQYVPQTRVIERPKIMLQERIIPVPRRRIEEQIIEVPAEEYEEILRTKLPEEDLKAMETEAKYAMEEENMSDRHTLKEVVEVPHVQHLYRNIMKPEFRHVPKPVGVGISSLAPNHVAVLVDRNVPIPVELEVVQEFLCPRVEPVYKEVPVPITVTRRVEKPIPADAMFNSVIMDAYLKGHPQPVSTCVQQCMGPPKILTQAMDEFQRSAAGIAAQPSLSHVAPFQSRGDVMQPEINVLRSGPQLLEGRSVAQPGHQHI